MVDTVELSLLVFGMNNLLICKRSASAVLTAIYWWDLRSRAEVQPLCSTATPAVHSGCSEGRFPDRYHWADMFRSAHIAGLHVHHHDRCRRRYSSFYPDILPVTPAALHCYQVLQGRHRSSSTAHPTGSGHKRTPRPAGIFLTVSCFFPPTSHAAMSAAAYFGTAWLPAAEMPWGRVFLLLSRTAHRYVSGPLLLSLFACLFI